MTSGSFSSFPINDIFIDRSERQRKILTGVKELAESIAKHGLIHPIVIERSGKLRVGETRLTACKSIGWTEISVQFLDELSESSLQLIELEENVRRVDLPWQDQCLAVEKYHILRQAENKEWNARKTAKALNISDQEVLNKRSVAKELLVGNKTITEAPRYSVARGIVARQAARKKDSVLKTIIEPVEADEIPFDVPKQVPLLNTSFLDWAPFYTGEKFNFIHCDFPYGINADKQHQTAAAAMGGYEDTPEVYFELLECLANAMNNVVSESAHLLFWFSMDYYQVTFELLMKMGWNVNPFPLIWHKSDNAGILPDPSREPRRIYETALHASRGDRKIVRAVSNVVSSPSTKIIHMSEKPKPVLRKFFELFVDEYTTILDPTAGSATALKVALDMKANTVLGLEKNKEFYKKAVEIFYVDQVL